MEPARAAVKDLGGLEALQRSLLESKNSARVTIATCCGTGCVAKGALGVFQALRQEAAKHRDAGGLAVVDRRTGCHGFCEQGPIVVAQPEGFFYTNVRQEDAAEIVAQTALGAQPVERLLYRDPVTRKRAARAEEIPFYHKQQRIVLGHNGVLDPSDIRDYIAAGGYRALWKALRELTPEAVIAEVEKSGLRGRGGAGFPTGQKWAACRRAGGAAVSEPAHGELSGHAGPQTGAPPNSARRYVVCNGDEGDPGAFMDRSILEGDPHSVIEGMIIGAFAVGASEGCIYVRNEYPLAVERLQVALEQAGQYGFLGADIFGSGFNFTIRINRGGGAFVCGESTALTASLEGRPGEPRMKYIRTVESGLWGRPTALNNVETWANVPGIINRGASWYAAIGTAGSKGTKVFSLVGKVNHTGLVEVPMGMTLREIIFDIGGGVQQGRRFKAVQTGGPSGGCIPAEHLDCPVDFDELAKLGSMMGSGGMIVMDEDTCMVEVARYFTHFLAEESCGKCVPCREGLTQMLAILDRITQGRGETRDLELLEFLCRLLQNAALCGLGTSACNPVLATLRYFKDEYLAHIEGKHCPAGVCVNLFHYEIDPARCRGCQRCLKDCAAGAITGKRKEPHLIERQKCTRCGACYSACRFQAVKKA
jgi:NADH-quinone oxidoreductase subunit F